MLRTHLKVAFRHIAKDKIYSVLNITGLAIATATAFLILQYLNFELAFDDFHTNGTKIYRIVTKKHSEREEKTSATTFYGVGTFLKQHFPEVEHVTRFYKWPASTGILMMHGDKIYNERNYVFADPEFFKVFPSLILQGDASTCLDGPNSIVISKKLALKIFGTYDVIGRTVKSLDKHRQELMITAIMPDLPINSNFDLDVIRPRDWIPDTEWDFFNDHTYVLLKDGTSVEEFESRLNFALEKNQRANPYYNGITLSLQNISEIHLHPQSIDELKHPGNKLILYLMGIAFMIVLLVAWVNHVNFEMGRLIQRIKEVALRRIIGSTKRNLIAQFLVQYITIQLIAVLLAGVIVYFVLPYFPIITGIPMRSLHLDIASALLPALGFFMTGILISCVYPSLLLLKTDLTSSLKGKLANAIDKMSVRKTLVIFQFVAALIITSLVIVISQQIELMRKSDLNVSLDRIVTIYNPTNYSAYEDSMRQEKNAVFRNKLMQHVGIDNLTSSSAIPGEPIGFTYVDLAKRTLNDPDRQIPYKVVYIDYDFLPVFDLKLKAGRNYDQPLDHW